MTIWEALVAIIILCAIIVAFRSYYNYVKAQLFRLERYEEWSNRFYSASKPLVHNPETPDQIIGLIESLNNLITDRVSPLALYRVFFRKLTNPSVAEEDGKADERLNAFFEKHSGLASNVKGAASAGLLAASYASSVGGIQARAVMADALSDIDTRKFAVGAARDVRAVSESAHRRSGLVPIIRGR